MNRQPARAQGDRVVDLVGPIGELGGAVAALLCFAGRTKAIRGLLRDGRREGRQSQRIREPVLPKGRQYGGQAAHGSIRLGSKDGKIGHPEEKNHIPELGLLQAVPAKGGAASGLREFAPEGPPPPCAHAGAGR